MLFSTPIFLFYFLPVAVAGYFLMPRAGRNGWLLLFSCGFFFWGAPRFFFVIFASALLDYLLGSRMSGCGARGRRWLVAVSLLNNLGILAYYKYTNFVFENVNALFSFLGWHTFTWEHVLLPIGVSFLVFEKITYIVDLYRGVAEPAGSLVRYLTYVFLFPKVLAGPIVKYHDLASQLGERAVRFEDVYRGAVRFAYGLFKKVFLADALGEYVDAVFALPAGAVSTGDAWLAALCFTMQIYMDFSSYSDMAIGLARVFGFRLMENFRLPYLAGSFSEFWRRWHISLSTWIRDYVYIPLGGSREGTRRTYRNLFLSFLASGLWHGANWTFVLWGVYHGLFVILDRAVLGRWQQRLPRAVCVAAAFFFLLLGWILFRSPDVGYALSYVGRLFVYQPVAPALGNFLLVGRPVLAALGGALVLSFLPGLLPRCSWEAQGGRLLWGGVGVCLLVLALSKAVTATFHPFLYFRF